MPTDAALNLVELLQRHRLLEPEQLATLSEVQKQFPEPRALAKELVARRWLTTYQANQLVGGHLKSLLLGPYVLLEKLGEGGMGQVFKARHTRLGRIDAIKLIRKERLDKPDAIKRFYREIKAAAALKHPNIVHAYDADEVDGVHYFAMEYIDGTDLAAVVKKRGPLPIAEACEYIRQAALGLQHAFERGLVHRDIKPHNLLIGHRPSAIGHRPEADSSGPIADSRQPTAVVKILDLGLARIAHAPADDKSSTMTHEGTVMGTPDYIAPEQTVDSHNVDIRADLYSLGCTLYFLLTGRAPFSGGSLGEKLVRHQLYEPQPLEDLRPDVPPEVVQVVCRLMRKKPAERYQTPAELAAALEGLPGPTTAAVPLSDSLSRAQTFPDEQLAASTPPESRSETMPLVERLRQKRMASQKRWEKQFFLAAGIIGGVLVVGFALFMLIRSLDKGDPSHPPEPVVKDINKKPLAKKPERPPTPEELEREFQAKRAAEGEAAYPALEAKFKAAGVTFEVFAKEVAAFKGKHGGTPAAIRAAEMLMKLPSPLDQLDPAKIPEDAKAAWKASGFDGKDVVAVLGEHRGRHWGKVHGVAYSPDGKLLASGGDDSVIRIWDADNLRERAVLKGHEGQINSVAFSPDSRLVMCAGSADAIIRVWELRTQKEVRKFEGHKTGVSGAIFSSDGRYVVSCGSDKTVRLWDVDLGKELRRFDARRSVDCVAISRDGSRVLSGGPENTMSLWDAETGQELHRFEGEVGGQIWTLVFCPEKDCAISGGSDGIVRLWNMQNGKELRRLEKSEAQVFDLAFANDGRLVIGALSDGSLRAWDVESGKQLRRFTGHVAEARRLAISPDSRRAVSASYDGTIRLWDVDTGKEVQPLTGPVGRCREVAFSPDDSTVASLGDDRSVRLWNPLTGQEKSKLSWTLLGPGQGGSVAFSPDGQQVLFSGGWGHGELHVAEAQSGKAVRNFAPQHGDSSFYSVAFSPDGRTALTGGWDGTVSIWELTSGRKIRDLDSDARPDEGHHFKVTALAFSPDGRQALGARREGRESVVATLCLWDVDTGKVLGRLIGHGNQVQSIAWCPSGLSAVSCSQGSDLWLWKLTPPRSQLRNYSGAPGEVDSLSWSPDGRQFVSGGHIGKLILWDGATLTKLREWQLPGPVHAVAFAADGRHLATANGNGTVYILRLPPVANAPGSPLTPEQAKQQQLVAAKALGVPVTVENSLGMKLNLIPAGRFLMGSPKEEEGRRDDEDQREVQITRPFYVGVFEVNQEQYRKLMKEVRTSDGGPDHPVDHVFWSEAVEFCRLLGELPAEKAAGRVYRLPTEAEWEYACRAGTTTPFAFGTSLSSLEANFDGRYPYGGKGTSTNRQKSTPCGAFKRNAFGLFDMHGNVWEWCSDWHQKERTRVIRGGGHLSAAEGVNCRSAHRHGHGPELVNYGDIGFRVVCEVPQGQQR